MCGIIAYLGKEEATPILIDGLKSMEYRGYDSAGVVVLDKENVFVEKSAGRVSVLEDKITRRGASSGTTGVGHTRWATHGGVTDANAHPHGGCGGSVYLVHNGIIENYRELKEELEKLGHKFVSETDTETVAHLVEEIKKSGVPLEEAVRLALQKVSGTYGLVVVDKDEPEKIVAARNFSPLILGVGKDELILASDATPILRFTNNVIYIHDGEIVTITPSGYRIRTIQDERIHREPEVLDWDIETAKKGNYPHFMIKEIHEEADAVRNTLRGRLDLESGNAVLGGLKDVEGELKKLNRVHICACGTASFAGMIGAYMLEEYAKIPAKLEVGSEFRYREPVFEKNDVFLAVSQSGETADTLASLYEAKEKGILTLGLVNVVGSTISRDTDAGVYLHAGPEISVASTKAFLSQVTAIVLFTLFVGRRKGMSLVVGKRIAEELKKIPALIENILRNESVIKEIAAKYAGYSNFFYLGRKYNYPIALEGALKLKETSYIHAEAYASGEMKHGAIALVDENLPSIVIAPKDSVYEKNVSNIQELKARGGLVIAIATEGDDRIRELVDDVIYIPKTLEMLTPLLSVVPLHLFAYYIAASKEVDVDKPRNLAKSVTVE